MVEAFVSALQKAWPFLVAVAPGAFALWRFETARRRGLRTDRKDLIKIAHDAAAQVIEQLQAEIDRLRAQLDEVDRELSILRKDHAEMMAQKDARITMLEGEKRALEAQVHSLENLLVRSGVTPPKPGATYWEMKDGQLEAIAPPAIPPA